MALLVFLTFMSLIVNQYVPVWMKDSEASHMDGTVGQFADLKGAIDFQVLGALMAQNAGAVFVPSTASSPVTMGIDGVPIFAGPTFGSLTSSPTCSSPSFCNWSVAFTYSINNVPIKVSPTSSGQIDLYVSNRYYPTGDIVYDNGAIIRSQSDGQVIVGAPVLTASKSGTNITFAFELVNLYGPGSASGTTTQIVNSNVFGVNQQTYSSVTATGTGIQIWHYSPFARAWFNFFNSTLSSDLTVGSAYTYTATLGGVTTVTSSYYKIILVQTPIQKYVELLFNPAGYGLTFTLQQAYVNVGIGSGSTMT